MDDKSNSVSPLMQLTSYYVSFYGDFLQKPCDNLNYE